MIATVLLLLMMQVSPELRQRVDAGLKAKAAGDLDTAVREFRRVTELAPELAAAHVNLGAVFLQQKSYSDAISPLKKALELDSTLTGAHAMLGTALLAQGFAAAAIPHLEKGQAEDLLGVALLESDRPREALDRLESALDKRPGDPDLLYFLTQVHERLSKQLFLRLQQGAGDKARLHQRTGEVLASTDKRALAEAQFRNALALRPDLRGVHYSIGELHLAAGNYEKAEEEFRAERQLVPGYGAAAFRLGSVLLHRGQLMAAIQELRRAHELQPDMPEVLLELGKALNSAGESASAARCLQRLLQLEEGTQLAATAHFQLAQSYRKLGREADANREMILFQKLRKSF